MPSCFMSGLVCAGGSIAYESDDSLLHSDEWLDVCRCALFRSPDGNCSDEMGEDVHVVELFHGVGWE